MKGGSINWKTLTSKFSTEDDCVAYLEAQRWKNGAYCTKCKCPDVYRHPTQKNQWYCRGYQKNFNVKIGTIFQRTRVSLDVWFAIIAEMLVNKAGISTLYVAELFSVNKDTAWRIMHKIREAMAKDMDGIKLSGIVECDEAGIGGDHKWIPNRPDADGVFHQRKRGFGADHKVCVIGFTQREERDASGNIVQYKKTKAVVYPYDSLDFQSLKSVASQHVDFNQTKTFMTDGLTGYRQFKKFVEHKFSIHSKRWYVDPDDHTVHTNNIEGVWRRLKANTLDIRHGVSKGHLQKYIDETCYKLNYRKQGSYAAFDGMLELGVSVN